MRAIEGRHRRGPLTKRSVAAVVVALALAASLAACGDDGDDAESVDVLVSEWVVEAEPGTVEAGEVTFDVDNQGAREHEVVVIHADHPDALVIGDAGAIDEDALHGMDIGHIEDVQPGETKSATFELAAGAYLLVCNLVDEFGDAHFAEGMVVPFTVTS